MIYVLSIDVIVVWLLGVAVNRFCKFKHFWFGSDAGCFFNDKCAIHSRRLVQSGGCD